MERKSSNSVYSSLVLDKVIRILRCLGRETPQLRYADFLDRLHMKKATLYRLLEAMRSHGLLEIDQTTGMYRLGITLFEFGTLAANGIEVGRSAASALEMLVKQTGETSNVCVLQGSDVMCVSRVEGRHVIRFHSAVGMRAPAYCTSVGRAIIAYLPEEELESYLALTTLKPLTRKTIVTWAELKKLLRQVRTQGYSVDDEEFVEGMRCVGAPIRDLSGRVIAGISISGPSARITKREIPKLAPIVMEAANDISKELGYRPTVKAVAQ